MSDQTGFEFREKLHEGTTTLVYRAIRRSDGAPVVLKMLKDAYASSEFLARFKREFEITASLNSSALGEQGIDGVITALASILWKISLPLSWRILAAFHLTSFASFGLSAISSRSPSRSRRRWARCMRATLCTRISTHRIFSSIRLL